MLVHCYSYHAQTQATERVLEAAVAGGGGPRLLRSLYLEGWNGKEIR